jgi:hypothetical protein
VAKLFSWYAVPGANGEISSPLRGDGLETGAGPAFTLSLSPELPVVDRYIPRQAPAAASSSE